MAPCLLFPLADKTRRGTLRVQSNAPTSADCVALRCNKQVMFADGFDNE